MDVVCFIGRTCPGDGRVRPFRQGIPIDSFTIALLWFCPEGRVEVVTITNAPVVTRDGKDDPRYGVFVD